MAAYLCYSFFLTGFVYPVACHAVWSAAGFLSFQNPDPLYGIGMIDFAGSGVIHLTGGTTALVATYLLGSRRGRFFDLRTGEMLQTPKPMPGHSVSLQVLGTFILWFGWFGFNAGSSLLLTDNPYQGRLAASCAVNTFLSSSGGCITAMLLRVLGSLRTGNHVVFDLRSAMNGTLTGLVAVSAEAEEYRYFLASESRTHHLALRPILRLYQITAGCGTLEPWAALVVGFMSGPFYLLSSDLLIYFKIDDVVDAIPVHFVGGIWGVLSVGLFSEPELTRQLTGTNHHPGFFYSLADGHSDARLLACQVLGIFFVFGWTLVTMLPFFLALNSLSWLRTEAVEEIVGLDLCYNDMGQKLDHSVEDEGMRDEFLIAFEEHKLKHKQRKRPGGSEANSVRSSGRSSARSRASSDC